MGRGSPADRFGHERLRDRTHDRDSARNGTGLASQITWSKLDRRRSGETAYSRASKARGRKPMWVQIPPPAPASAIFRFQAHVVRRSARRRGARLHIVARCSTTPRTPSNRRQLQDRPDDHRAPGAGHAPLSRTGTPQRKEPWLGTPSSTGRHSRRQQRVHVDVEPQASPDHRRSDGVEVFGVRPHGMARWASGPRAGPHQRRRTRSSSREPSPALSELQFSNAYVRRTQQKTASARVIAVAHAAGR